ncbi:MAG: RDD family protein [Planctomycetes bacterium]|nr:RDD family protein [Planctomycetota bacterium]
MAAAQPEPVTPPDSQATEEVSSRQVHRPALLAASSDRHQWYVRRRQVDAVSSYVLLHHGPGMDDPADASLVPQSLRSQPEAIAAAARDLYIVFRPGAASADGKAITAGSAGRTVISLRAIAFDERTGTWMHSAAGRVRTLPSLPSSGRVVGFEIYPELGPVVLLYSQGNPEPSAEDETSPDTQDQAEASDDDMEKVTGPGSGYRLYQLGSTQWQPWPIETILGSDSASTDVKLLAGQVPRLLVAALPGTGDDGSDDAAHMWVPDQDAPSRWIDSGSIDVRPADIVDSVELHGRTFLLTREGGGQPSRVSLILDDTAVLPITDLPSPAGERRLIKAGPGLGIVGQVSSSSSLQLTLIDVETGLIGDTESVEPPTPLATDWFRPLILIAGLLLAGIVMFIFRPERRTGTLTLPPGVSLAEPQVRFLALVVDLALCALPALFVTGGSPSDLIRTPLLATSWSQVVPALAMYLLCCGYSMIMEWMSGRTVGKALFSLKVATMAGKRPSLLQCMVRSLMKFIVLLIPPLILFVMMNPLRQRLGDQAARTVVLLIEEVDDHEAEKDDEGSNDPPPPRQQEQEQEQDDQSG